MSNMSLNFQLKRDFFVCFLLYFNKYYSNLFAILVCYVFRYDEHILLIYIIMVSIIKKKVFYVAYIANYVLKN